MRPLYRPRAELALRLVSDVARALLWAWSQGIVHMDLRPHNIVVAAEDEVELTNAILAAQTPAAGEEGTVEQGRTMGAAAGDWMTRFARGADDASAGFRAVLVDWASSLDVGETPMEVTGLPAFQSSALLGAFDPLRSLCSVASLGSMTRQKLMALTRPQSPYTVSPSEDLQALSHTFTTLLHGGDTLVAPWAHVRAEATANHCGHAAARNDWYEAHKATSPLCPCIAFHTIAVEVPSPGGTAPATKRARTRSPA
jgi:hypothetical protein